MGGPAPTGWWRRPRGLRRRERWGRDWWLRLGRVEQRGGWCGGARAAVRRPGCVGHGAGSELARRGGRAVAGEGLPSRDPRCGTGQRAGASLLRARGLRSDARIAVGRHRAMPSVPKGLDDGDRVPQALW